jgi:hypothetical protein
MHKLWASSVLAAAVLAAPAARPGQLPSSFAGRVQALSEPGGYFDTDDLVSNERSYLHVVPALQRADLAGTAYIGVGPDTSFSYIAQTRPSVAFIVDLRRDNLLLHLLFKALFAESPTRIAFLSALLGRAPPPASDPWRTADLARIIDSVDRAPTVAAAPLRARLDTVLTGFGVPLSAEDRATIDRFHQTFVTQGFWLKLEIFGRGSPAAYPTFRELLLETDQAGHRWSYLASEDDYQFVRTLEAHDLVIPVVGDLAGPSALRNIGRLMTERGVTLGAFYASNVEFYLFRDATFAAYTANLAQLPHDARSVIIRSVFPSGGAGYLVPMLPGYGSASLVGGVTDLLQATASGRVRSYADLLARPAR